MALLWLPYVESRYAPACYEDFLKGKVLYQRLAYATDDVCMVEIKVTSSQAYLTIAGAAHFLTWQWKDCLLQTCQGLLHERKFKDEQAYKQATGCHCRLFVKRDGVLEANLQLPVYLETYKP